MPTAALAARLVRHGAPLEIAEVILPDPLEDELLVELAFAGVNPVDHYIALGRVAPEGPLPRTLGSEATGLVEGAPVLVRGHGLGARRDGLFATAAVVPRAAVVRLPPGVDLAAAASMGVAGLTAWRTAVELGDLRPDDRVLVLGASGGVGSIVCSLAARRGARVWAQTAHEDKRAFLVSLGIEQVVVCDAEGLAEAAGTLAPTIVFDGLGGPFTGAALRALAPLGRLVLYGTSAGATAELPLQHLYRNGQRLLGYGGLSEPEERARPALNAALVALASGELEVVVGAVVPLGKANEAFAQITARTVRGQVVLDLRRGA